MLGWKRLLGVLGCAGLGVIAAVVFKDALYSVLRWVDMLAPKPGLSGLLLLALAPVAFLLLAALMRWILVGFGPDETLPRPRP